jgi:hypothetical protein
MELRLDLSRNNHRFGLLGITIVDRKSLEHMYFSYVRPILEYADVIWDNCPNYIKEKLEHINYEAARIITGAKKLTSPSG